MKAYINIFVFLIVLVSTASAQRNCYLWLNEIPLVADTSAHKLYATLEPDAAYALKGTLTWSSNVYDNVELNGTSLASVKDNFSIKDWSEDGQNILSLTNTKGEVSQWTMVFSTLPFILLEANQTKLYDLWKIDNTLKHPADITVIDACCRTKKSPMFFCPIGIRVRGATSAGKEKKSFAIELLDSLGEERSVHLLGHRDDGDWILDAMFNDFSRMRNRVIMDLWRTVDKLPYAVDNAYQSNGTEGEYVEVFMQGKYHGMYCLSDKIDRKKLNLKKTKEATATNDEEIRGQLWKGLFRSEATTFTNYKTDPKCDTLVWESYWEQKYPDDRQDQGDFSPIAHAIDIVGKNSSDSHFKDSVNVIFYPDNVLDYVIFTQAFQLMDNLQKNLYLSVRNVQNEERVLITLWDLDASMGRDAGGDKLFDDKKWLAFGEQLGGINYLVWRLKNKKPNDFVNRLNNRWQYLKTHTLSIDSVRNRMEKYAYQFEHSGAWNREKSLWARKMASTINEEIDYMCSFLEQNYAAFDAKVAAMNPDPYVEPADDSMNALYIIGKDSVCEFEGNKAVVPGTVVMEPIEGISSINYFGEEMTVNRDGDANVYNVARVKQVSTKPQGLYATNAFVPKVYAHLFDFDTHYTKPKPCADSMQVLPEFSVSRTLWINFEDDTVKVVGNTSGFEISTQKSHITINSPHEGSQYVVSGTCNDALMDISGAYQAMVTLSGANVFNTNGFVIYNEIDAPLLLVSNGHNVVSGVHSKSQVELYGTGDIQFVSEVEEQALIESEDNVVINGGVISMFTPAFNGKGIYGHKNVEINNGSIYIITSGSGTVADDALKTEGNRAILAEKVITVNGGELYVKTVGPDGGAGLAALNKIHINDGLLALACFDDPINAVSGIEIKGGTIICSSLVDDGMDSNGSITISGGNLYVYGSYPNEGAFDNDGKTFAVTGGTIIGIGAKSDYPQTSKSTQAYLYYKKGAGLKRYARIVDEEENVVCSFETPGYEKSTLLYSSPDFKRGTTYILEASEDGIEYNKVTSLVAQ